MRLLLGEDEMNSYLSFKVQIYDYKIFCIYVYV